MPERTKDGKVQASNDGITWTDLYTISTAIPSGQYTTIEAVQIWLIKTHIVTSDILTILI